MRSGFTLIEGLVIIAVLGILAGIAFLDVRPLENTARNGANELAATLRQARSRAMATTSAYRLVLVDAERVVAQWRRSCGGSEPWSDDPRFDLALPRGATVVGGVDVGQPITCFDSRGIGDASPLLVIRDARGREATVDVLAGGAVRVE